MLLDGYSDVPAGKIAAVVTSLEMTARPAAGRDPAQPDLSLELVAALLMAVSGMAVAVVHVWLALQDRWPVVVQCLWMVAGCSLFAGMLLAALYGVRSVFAPWPWLDIPWMRALHGTINALGFGLCGTLGWWVAVNKQPLDT